jgi:hypothetical protein
LLRNLLDVEPEALERGGEAEEYPERAVTAQANPSAHWSRDSSPLEKDPGWNRRSA